MTENTIYCEKCYQIFQDVQSLQRHTRKNTNSCYQSYLLICQKIDEQRNVVTELKTQLEALCEEHIDELNLKDRQIKVLEEQKKEFDQKMKDLEEKHKLEITNLIYVQPGVKNRTDVYENIKSQKVVSNFETLIDSTNIDIKTLRSALKLGVEGDLLLFKKIFFDNFTKETCCIRVRDFARDKYQVFDGKEWLTVTLDHIVDQFMLKVFSKYKPVIAEKHAQQDAVDEKYPRWKYKKRNMEEFDRINDMYTEETTHYGTLAAMTPEHASQLKVKIRSMISENKSLIE